MGIARATKKVNVKSLRGNVGAPVSGERGENKFAQTQKVGVLVAES